MVVLRGPVLAVDVDDTIVSWDDSKFSPDEPRVIIEHVPGDPEYAIPNLHLIEHIKRMKRRGHCVVIWSGGEFGWAESVVKALGLGNYVDVVCSKFKYHMDDKRDPKDKLGSWSYIGFDGKVYREDNSGNIIEHKGDIDEN